MEVKEALLKRRSVRKFTEEAVSEEDINELLHAAMSGPSACILWQYHKYIQHGSFIKCMHTCKSSMVHTRIAQQSERF